MPNYLPLTKVLHACCCRRERTPPEVRLVREKEKELAALERATRTIFTYNLHPKATERDIFEFFSKVRVRLDPSCCCTRQRTQPLHDIYYLHTSCATASATICTRHVQQGAVS